MCLTAEAYRERKWGHLPALRKALEDKDIPSSYYGLTTASDNMFDAITILIEIAVLTSEYQFDIKETATSMGREEMTRDLKTLEGALEQASCFFKSKIEEIQTLCLTL